MIDKTLVFISVIILTIHYASTAPTAVDMKDKISEDIVSSKTNNDSKILFTGRESSASSTSESIIYSNSPQNVENGSNSKQTFSDKGQLQATQPSSKSDMKARKNKNDLYFCCTEEDTIETATVPFKRNKDRERNTKPPILKREKNSESEEPQSERRPALLLRFFPDGTAVLISKFQLHLHVKPKKIKFEPDDGSEEETLEFNPDFILNDGKSYEVTYKRLEAVPSLREQNEFDLDESEEREAYREDMEHRDHEFITTPATGSHSTNVTLSNDKSLPLQDSTTSFSSKEPDNTTTVTEIRTGDKNEKLPSTVGDSPFFIMTLEEMSSLQQQYDPASASPLKATTSVPLSSTDNNITDVSKEIPPMTLTTSTQHPLDTDSSSRTNTIPSAATTRCLSFKNQLSLALSTEDNIDNSLLKRHIFPTQDCNNSISDIAASFARLKSSEITTKATPTTLPIITRQPPEPTTHSYSKNNLVPYLTSHFSNNPTNPDVVVVTSLPVIIDLKSTRKQPVTDVPAWREVTVGVVRDQQGKPLKAKYNNWETHLRNLRKQTDNKFWKDFTTLKPSFRSHSREPLRQNIQQSQTQTNRAFWTDLQKQIPVSDQRNKVNDQLYRENPPRTYRAPSKNDFQFWRIGAANADNRWNSRNTNNAEYGRSQNNGPVRSPHHTFDNTESRLNHQWNHGNPQQNNRRW